MIDPKQYGVNGNILRLTNITNSISISDHIYLQDDHIMFAAIMYILLCVFKGRLQRKILEWGKTSDYLRSGHYSREKSHLLIL